MFPQAQAEVLLVEDNEGDVSLVRQSLIECDRPVALTVARDGEEALRLLRVTHFSPDLVILDLNIPRLSGLAVLERLNLKDTPVVVFSSSCNTAELQHALSLGVRECIVKPMDVGDFINAVCGMIKTWARAKKKRRG